MYYAGDEWCDDDITSGPLEEMHDLAGEMLADIIDNEQEEELRAHRGRGPWYAV